MVRILAGPEVRGLSLCLVALTVPLANALGVMPRAGRASVSSSYDGYNRSAGHSEEDAR